MKAGRGVMPPAGAEITRPVRFVLNRPGGPEGVEMTATATNVDFDAFLREVPADLQAAARLRVAAWMDATTEEERERVKWSVVDETLRVAAERGWCEAAENALSRLFGPPEGGVWRTSEGFDRYGRDADGYNRDGFGPDGYNRDGFDRNGRNRAGLDADGLDRDGRDADGYDRDGYDRHGFNREHLDRDGRSEYRFNVAGFDPDGFNRQGRDAAGYDRDGFNAEGWNRDGFNRDGQELYRFDPRGFDREGYMANGGDRDGFTREQNAAANRPPHVRTDHPLYPAYEAWYSGRRDRF